MSDFCTEKAVKARKGHLCCECSGIIDPGVSYMLISGAQDGQGFSYKRCVHCHAGAAWLDAALRVGPHGLAPDEGITFGSLHSELAEYASESRFTDPVPLELLCAMNRRRIETEKRYRERGAA